MVVAFGGQRGSARQSPRLRPFTLAPLGSGLSSLSAVGEFGVCRCCTLFLAALVCRRDSKSAAVLAWATTSLCCVLALTVVVAAL